MGGEILSKFQAPKGVSEYVPPNSNQFEYVRDQLLRTARLAGYNLIELPVFEDIKSAIDDLSKTHNLIESNQEKIKTLELENEKDGYLISDAFLILWTELRNTYQTIKALDGLNADLIDKNESLESLDELQESDQNTINQIDIQIKQYQDENEELSKKLEFCDACGQRLENA